MEKSRFFSAFECKQEPWRGRLGLNKMENLSLQYPLLQNVYKLLKMDMQKYRPVETGIKHKIYSFVKVTAMYSGQQQSEFEML